MALKKGVLCSALCRLGSFDAAEMSRLLVVSPLMGGDFDADATDFTKAMRASSSAAICSIRRFGLVLPGFRTPAKLCLSPRSFTACCAADAPPAFSEVSIGLCPTCSA
jgi:hypothetical protein